MSEEVICEVSTKKRVDQTLVKLCGWKGIHCHSFNQSADSIVAGLKSTHHAAKCPFCGRRSSSVHSNYERTIAELPVHGLEVILKVEVSRYRCLNPKCLHKTFTAQCTGLTERYQRRTQQQREALEAILGLVAATVGARQCTAIGMPISPSTALRVVRGISHEVDYTSFKHICIDDFASRKGQEYRTLIIDADTHTPLEIVSSREKDDVRKALKKYKRANLVSRDRSGAYSVAIREALPRARQVADKFHLVKNCGEHLEKQIKASMTKIKQETLAHTNTPVEDGIDTTNLYGPPTERDKALFKVVHDAHDKGLSNNEIARMQRLDHRTVAKYLSMTEPRGRKIRSPEETLRYIDIIKKGVACGKGYTTIQKDILAVGGNIGYDTLITGMKKIFPEYRPKQGAGCHNSPLSEANRERSVVSSLLTSNKMKIYVANPDYGVNRETGECSKERIRAEQLVQKSKTLQDLRGAYSSFRSVLSGTSVKDLDQWIQQYRESEYAHIASFATRLQNDISAIRNALRYDISNGPMEGCNNKVKAVKRSMYGRAKDDLLLIKIILYTRNNLHEN